MTGDPILRMAAAEKAYNEARDDAVEANKRLAAADRRFRSAWEALSASQRQEYWDRFPA